MGKSVPIRGNNKHTLGPIIFTFSFCHHSLQLLLGALDHKFSLLLLELLVLLVKANSSEVILNKVAQQFIIVLTLDSNHLELGGLFTEELRHPQRKHHLFLKLFDEDLILFALMRF